jgi:FtsH-binding integral membrane protein
MIIRILCFALLLSFSGLTRNYLLYEYSRQGSWFYPAWILWNFIIVSLFVYMWVRDGERIRGFKAFASFYVAVLAVVFISSSINLGCEYLLYNHLDKQYKYERERSDTQDFARHRAEKGLPPPIELSDAEIDVKYSFNGLLKTNQAMYVINFFYTFIFYPIAFLLWYIVGPEENKPQNRRKVSSV